MRAPPARMSSPVVLPDIEEDVDVGKETAEEHTKPYHLILLDDNDHTAEYVIEMLMELLAFPLEKAKRHTLEVDRQGHSILTTLPLAEAEAKRDAIHAYGPDWRLPRSPGAMAALVEPAE